MSDEVRANNQDQLWANYHWRKRNNLLDCVSDKMLEITGQQKRWYTSLDIISYQFQSVYILTRFIDKISSREPIQYESFTHHWHEANDQFIALADMFLDA